MSKTATIIKHTHSRGSCHLGKILEEQKVNIRSMGVMAMDLDGFDPLEPDLLLIMGAPIGVYQAEDFPFIKQEESFVRARIEADLPTLGICFGSQLIAHVLGANVYPGKEGCEIGWHRLNMTEEGKNHPVRHLSGEVTSMFHWHKDTFDLPKGATLLARSDKYKQAFSYGKNILALQCHTEIIDTRLEEMYIINAHDITGPAPAVPIRELRNQSEKHIGALNIQAEKFFTEWLESVGLL